MILAHKPVVPRDLLADFEAGVSPSENNLSAVRTALEEVAFLEEDSMGGIRVRLSHKSRTASCDLSS